QFWLIRYPQSRHDCLLYPPSFPTRRSSDLGGERLGYSFGAFKDRWFKSIQVGAQRFAVRLEPHDFAQEQIQERLSDICLTLDAQDRKSTRLNSSHVSISYVVFCL